MFQQKEIRSLWPCGLAGVWVNVWIVSLRDNMLGQQVTSLLSMMQSPRYFSHRTRAARRPARGSEPVPLLAVLAAAATSALCSM